jgi:hypothetical protein
MKRIVRGHHIQQHCYNPLWRRMHELDRRHRSIGGSCDCYEYFLCGELEFDSIRSIWWVFSVAAGRCCWFVGCDDEFLAVDELNRKMLKELEDILWAFDMWRSSGENSVKLTSQNDCHYDCNENNTSVSSKGLRNHPTKRPSG